ncbi:hypothetical protein WOLCODRAFT_138764 [Wolfiporia cocos MD-104 SS10]|uniref:Uncharacterized protein n=1 Tax=Wolfiporia cocos (strain MD-104) TaxID=742152 RepID=A0A2H3JPF4_WOLCO|nr:hypothetical protein WOLCODRAFT_138764 [Wolfiporia cocos MD-104 SS10]
MLGHRGGRTVYVVCIGDELSRNVRGSSKTQLRSPAAFVERLLSASEERPSVQCVPIAGYYARGQRHRWRSRGISGPTRRHKPRVSVVELTRHGPYCNPEPLSLLALVRDWPGCATSYGAATVGDTGCRPGLAYAFVHGVRGVGC